jgi:hypothetical protein
MRYKNVLALIVTASTLCCVLDAAAALSASGRVPRDSYDGSLPRLDASDFTTTDSLAAIGISSYTPGLFPLAGVAIARAEYGVLRVLAVSEAQHFGDVLYENENVRASAYFTDSLTINIPGVMSGTPGQATFNFDLHGSLGASNNGLSDLSDFLIEGSLLLEAGVNGIGGELLHDIELTYPGSDYHARGYHDEYVGSGVIDNHLEYYAPTTGPGGYYIQEMLSIPFDFVVGQSFDVFVSLEARAHTSSDRDAVGTRIIATVDGMNTANFAGFSDIMLSDGTTISEFTAFGTAAGTDYSAAISTVPLPGALVLMVPALGLLTHRFRSIGITPPRGS